MTQPDSQTIEAWIVSTHERHEAWLAEIAARYGVEPRDQHADARTDA